ncbi:MAG: carboxypeptidase-like regulatory domain-containing protein [Flavobacteriaceae bacterium]
MKKSFFLLQLLVFLMVGLAAFAQTVTGVVMSEDGPLPGATIIIKGTTQGTTSDFDGNFSINADADAVLQVSFVGFVSQDFPVNNQQNITIMLASDNALDEVVVTTGYGTQSKRDITGAVSTIEAKDLTAVPATTFSQQMQGRASGISIVSDATPGGEATVRIRGFGTTGNNNPLYVIDGVPSQSQGNLNPQDIESLQILKDASAASIYGSRVGNGVIIITTKKGKVGEPTLTQDPNY